NSAKSSAIGSRKQIISTISLLRIVRVTVGIVCILQGSRIERRRCSAVALRLTLSNDVKYNLQPSVNDVGLPPELSQIILGRRPSAHPTTAVVPISAHEQASARHAPPT